uniref:ATP-binding cassette domain-containing protein n=1 Tax=Collinsella sp. D33t1_170424_A12 TaxID=2787135 RepID=UPI00189A1077
MPAAVDPRSNTSCIELSHVDFHYGDDGDAPALHDICLRIEAGEHVCILGGNGSGKSTLVQLMNALLVPCAGTATVFGLDTALPDAVAPIRQQAAMVFQHPEDQMTTSIVADDVAFGPENLGIPSKQIAQRVDDALATVEMAAFAQAD